MDKLLESLRQVYGDIDEEQRILRIIEDILLVPSTIVEADATQQGDEELPPEDPAADLAEPVAEPAAEPAPAEKPLIQPTMPKVPEPSKDVLPDIQKSQVKTPAPKQPAPKQAAVPAQPPVVQPKLPKTAAKTASAPPSNDVSGVLKKLQNYRKRGMIFRSPLQSSALSYMSYNPKTRGLNVTFTKNGRTYHYKGVGMDKAAQLFVSNSKGKFYNADIKPVHQPAREVT
jgi:hypothetical protein